MAPKKPTRKAAVTQEEMDAKAKAADKAAVKKVAIVGATAAAAAAIAVAGRPKRQRIIAIVLAAVFVLLVVGGGLGWLLMPKATINFYYVDDSLFEYEDYAGPELLDTATLRLFSKTTLQVPDYFDSDDITDWSFAWFSDADCSAPAANLSVGFDDLGKTKDLYCILVYKGVEGGEVTLPVVTEGNYPAYNGEYYDGVEWTIEWLYTRLHTGFKPTSYDFAGKGGGLIQADTPYGETNVRGIYNGQQFEADWKSGKNFEREHVWCNSLLGMPRVVSTGKNQASDLHNLRAIGGVYSGGINQTRSNRYFTECDGGPTCTLATGKHTGHTVGAGGFYPGDDYIGDVARILMYMVVMYYNILIIPEDVSVFEDAIAYSPLYAFMPIASIYLLCDWNTADPVNAFERHRNDVIFGLQGNRNPFIDNSSRLPEVLALAI